ncbi:MAG: hypothetical protein KAU28_08830, partial [Phycisphaerae bacterium]|nr:hypothetical protein [Phycisphaerae bacterium]
ITDDSKGLAEGIPQVAASRGLDPVQCVLDRLEGVRQTSPRQWQARCPAHDDKHASLSVGRGDGGWISAGCPARESLTAMQAGRGGKEAARG